MDEVSEENVDNKDDNIRENRMRRRQNEWLKKCVSNFSLYAHLVSNTSEDPFGEFDEDIDSINNKIEFKQKLSKSAKKRIRRQKKKKQNKLALSAKPSQMKVTSVQTVRKQTKKDLKKIIRAFKNLSAFGAR